MNQTNKRQEIGSLVPAEGDLITNPVFILGSHKSGTSLMRSLLDDHDELVVFPRETHFFQYSGHWVDYAYRRSRPISLKQTPILKSFVRYIEDQNKTIDPYSDAPDSLKYNLERFKSCFRQYATQSLHELFEAYMASLYYALFGSYMLKASKIVEKSVENAEFATVLRWLFPDSRFVHIVRNPYATLVSLRRSKYRGFYPSMTYMARSLYNSYYYLYKNRIHLDNYMVIRYEDMLTDTRPVLEKVAEFINIRFSEKLLTPTSLGQAWGGNSSTNQQFSGISNTPMYNWQNYIKDYEIHLINRIGKAVLDEFNYEKICPKHRSIRPIKGETLKTYIKNRTLLSFF